jgi:class 3 adenylate cyclase
LIDFLESNLPYLLNLVFLIFGIVSLNLKENLPRFFQFLVVALIYLFIVDIAVTMIIVLESDLEKYLPLYHRYFSRLPTGITHFVFIISALMMLRKGVILAFPLFLADILNASTLLLPYLSSLANLTNTSAPIFNIYSNFFDYVCFSVQSIIMATSIVSRIKSMQDQLNLREKTHRELVENQNRVLEETVAERTKDLKLESQKSERLMLNILPESIASRLKAGDDSISDSYQNATILFSDLVGFTKMSSSKTAEELVFLLNDLFKRFDTRATSLGLEKIKTIGDAYMVAGGLPTQDDTHAIRVTKMALGMYEDLDAFNKEHSMELGMRIGINSGPVVAGVIGHSKFSYDLWGNTVNTASRMESTCMPGKVQVSPSTYEQIKGHFDVQENQIIECKGLGQIMTYFVK